MKDTRTKLQRHLPGAVHDLDEYKDGDQIFLRMFCAHCHWNKTDQIGFILDGREYCAKCYPSIVNAYLAAKKVKKSIRINNG